MRLLNYRILIWSICNTMEIVLRKIKELKNADYNPRKISNIQLKQLTDSLQTYNCVEPAVININPERKNIKIGC